MKFTTALGLSVVNCIVFVISGIVHRIVVRRFHLPIDNLLIYWGVFASIILVISLLVLLVFKPKSLNKVTEKNIEN